jgi:uncharacterized membrane protein
MCSCAVEILMNNSPWKEASNMEVQLIKEIGRHDLNLGGLIVVKLAVRD